MVTHFFFILQLAYAEEATQICLSSTFLWEFNNPNNMTFTYVSFLRSHWQLKKKKKKKKRQFQGEISSKIIFKASFLASKQNCIFKVTYFSGL